MFENLRNIKERESRVNIHLRGLFTRSISLVTLSSVDEYGLTVAPSSARGARPVIIPFSAISRIDVL